MKTESFIMTIDDIKALTAAYESRTMEVNMGAGELQAV